MADQHLISAPTRLSPARMTDNELIFFDEQAQESWIIYPPRSAYEHVRRPTTASTVVEHHPWAPASPLTDHVLTPAAGCSEHGIDCPAYLAVRRAAELGWNPFA